MELLLFTFLLIYQAIALRNLKTSLRKSREKELLAQQKRDKLLHAIYFSLQHNKQPLPAPLLSLPPETSLLAIREVKIPSIASPYNAALTKDPSGYSLFFRYDTPSKTAPYISNIGVTLLDENFHPIEPFIKIETGSPFSEDARFFQSGKNAFLLYNDRDPSNQGMRLALLNEEKTHISSITSLPSFTKMEKNWTPFLHQNEIHFLYDIQNAQTFSLKTNELSSPTSSSLDWQHRFGPLRGGTPAILIDGEYLSFFHSSFEDAKGVLWYVMGAYTFQADPFSLTRISSHPILFPGIYETPHQPLAHPKVRAIYPIGLIQEGETLHVSCGENDSTIKILSFNTEKLLTGLKSLARNEGDASLESESSHHPLAR